MVLVALAACGRGVETAVESGPDGLRLVLPAAWSCETSAVGEEGAGRMTCTEGGAERLVVLSTPDAREGQVEGTEASARSLERQLDIAGFNSTRERVFVDGHYMVRSDYSGADGSGSWWTSLSTEATRLFQVHLVGADESSRAMVEKMRFTATYPVVWESGPLVVTARETGALGVLAVGLFLLIALGRKLVLDLPRVFADPGGLFGDFGRGETIWYPAAAVLCSSFLLAGTLSLFESQYMAWVFSEQVEPVTRAIHSTVLGHRYVNEDPELAAVVLGGVRAGLVAAWRNFFTMTLWLLPLIWVAMWIANGTGVFLGGKAAKGEAIWTRSYYASAMLAGPSALLWGGLAVSVLEPSMAVFGWVAAGLGAVTMLALGIQGFANLMRIPAGQAPLGWFVARVVWAIVLGVLVHQMKGSADTSLATAARPDYDVVQELRLY